MEEVAFQPLPFQNFLPSLQEKQAPRSFGFLCFPKEVIVSFAISAGFLMALTAEFA